MREAIYYPSLRTMVTTRRTLRVPLNPIKHHDPQVIPAQDVLDAIDIMNRACEAIGHKPRTYRLCIDEFLPLEDDVPDALKDVAYYGAQGRWTPVAFTPRENLASVELRLQESVPHSRHHWWGFYTLGSNGKRQPMSVVFETKKAADAARRRVRSSIPWWGTHYYVWEVDGVADYSRRFAEPEDADDFKPTKGSIVELVEIWREQPISLTVGSEDNWPSEVE